MTPAKLDHFIRGLDRLLDDGPATLERYARKPASGQGHFAWDADKHPRGHEGNAGQFAARGDGRPAATLDTKPFALKDGAKDRPKQGSLLEGKAVEKTPEPKPAEAALPGLKGTPKQVEWAERVRAKMLAALGPAADDFRDRDASSWWIDRRDDSPGDLLAERRAEESIAAAGGGAWYRSGGMTGGFGVLWAEPSADRPGQWHVRTAHMLHDGRLIPGGRPALPNSFPDRAAAEAAFPRAATANQLKRPLPGRPDTSR